MALTAAIAVLTIGTPKLLPTATSYWHRAFAVHLDLAAIRAATQAGDVQTCGVLKDSVATIPQNQVADDSRPPVAEALANHLSAVVDEGPCSGRVGSSWQQNLFEIVELNQDGTLNRQRQHAITGKVEDWVKTTLSNSGNPTDHPLHSGGLSNLVLERTGKVYGLSVEPQVRSAYRYEGSQTANKEEEAARRWLKRQVVMEGIVRDPALLPQDIQDEVAKNGGVDAALSALSNEDPKQPSKLAQYLQQVVDHLFSSDPEHAPIPPAAKPDDLQRILEDAGSAGEAYLQQIYDGHPHG